LTIIGITGSNGKTIVKEWLYQLLKYDEQIVRSPRSYNSQIGVPLSIFQIKANHSLGIFEAGISQSGEMELIASIINPDIGIFTNIGDAHQEGFNSEEEKVKEKALLFKDAKVIIFNKDYITIDSILNQYYPEKKKISWAFNNNDVSYPVQIENTKVRIGEHLFNFPFHDKASIENLIHCVVCLLYLKKPLDVIQKGLNAIFRIKMRMQKKEGINGSTIINDAYNFDLTSFQLGIAQINTEYPNHPKTIILSDFPSIQEEDQVYANIASLIKKHSFSRVIGIGIQVAALKNKLDSSIDFHHFNSNASFLSNELSKSFNKEVIYLKGARKFAFEKISEALSLLSHHVVLEIDLNAIEHNIKYFSSKLKSDTKIMAMVKASAYGSGSMELAKFLEFQKVDYFAVANVDEAISLRNVNIQLPILVLNPEIEVLDLMLKHQLEAEIYSLDFLDQLIERLDQEGNQLPIHININTGMNRLGVEPNELPALLEKLDQANCIIVRSVFSHLSSSEDAKDDLFTQNQLTTFERLSQQVVDFLNNKKAYQPFRHILNSSGILRFPNHQFDLVRLGIGLYGIESSHLHEKHLKKAHRLKAKILQLRAVEKDKGIGYNRNSITQRASIIATVGIGYADGLMRACGNRNYKVVVNGHKSTIIGNVSMDMTTIDVTDVPDVKVGDEVVIFDTDGSLETLAEACNTIPYEILSRISTRVKRVFIQE
ncbi:MAG: bifunctional UDP-N-acetylmuramoyl-tripeptide:D-alanyl-D-alanine ligase/alanine racemase, partial [Bacteroidota bacterium]